MDLGSEISSTMLLGRDHTVFGEVSTVALSREFAVGISCGAFPKGYSSVELNEDAVFAAAHGDAAVLAVVDGHNGFAAAAASIAALAAGAPTVLEGAPADRPRLLAATLESVRVAVASATEAPDDLAPISRSAITVALVGDRDAHVATLGDTVVVRLGWRPTVIAHDSPFLGPETRPGELRLRRVRRRGRGLVLVSDGVYRFLGPKWPARVAEAAAAASSAEALAASVMEAANVGGAGDNLAVAAWLPPS